MTNIIRYVSLGSLLILGALQLMQCSSPKQWSRYELQELDSLRQARNYFTLRSRITEDPQTFTPTIHYYQAIVDRAFNRPAKSNRHLNKILSSGQLPDSLITKALSMKMYNSLRLHSYKESLEAAERILERSGIPEETRNEVLNTRLILEALEETPHQKLTKNGDSILKLKDSHIDVRVNGQPKDYAYDTGANFSFLMASEAEELGIEIREAGFNVSTGSSSLKGDVGVADSMRIGNMTLANVVFLIFPDEALTFPNFEIRGIIGFPVLEAMGELRFGDGTIFVPQKVPEREINNLLLDGLTPIVRFHFEESELLGRLDTGARKTEFYKSFFRKFLSEKVDSARLDTMRIGSVGGISSHPVYHLLDTGIEVAGKQIQLEDVYVHLDNHDSTRDDYLYANLGLDMLAQFEGYILNFRDMAFMPY